MYSYYFYSPLDQSPIIFKSLKECRIAAKEYLGKEDWEGETVTKLSIYRSEKVETIS